MRCKDKKKYKMEELIMEKTIEQIEKQVKDSGLYLNLEGNGRDVKDIFYFGVKLAEGKTLDDFFDCFEPLHSKLESEKDLDVHVPVTLIKPSEYAFYNMSLEDAYQNGETVFRPEDDIYNVIIDTTASTSMEGNLLDISFKENKGIVLGEIAYNSHISYEGYEKFNRLSPENVPVQDIWNNVMKKLVNKMEETNLLDNNRNNSIVFTDDIGKAMKWEEQMYKQKEPANLSPDPKPVTPSKDLGKQ